MSDIKIMNLKVAAGVCRFAILFLVASVIAGCGGFAGMMAAGEYRAEETKKYVFAVPAEKLLDETINFLSGGGLGAVLTGGLSMSSLEIDRDNMTVAQPWRGSGSMMRQRDVAKITRVDGSRSRLTIHTEGQTKESSGEWRSQSLSRSASAELEVIKRLDPKKAAEIEAGAQKAAELAKK